MILLQPGGGSFVALGWRFALVLAAGALLMETLNINPDELRPVLQSPVMRGQSKGERLADAVERARQDYSAVATRPLFHVSRAPWVPPPPPEPEPAPAPVSPLLDYTLVGVILSGDMRTALLRLGRENRTVSLGEGQELEGWTLREVSRDRVVFSSQDENYEMSLVKPSESQR